MELINDRKCVVSYLIWSSVHNKVSWLQNQNNQILLIQIFYFMSFKIILTTIVTSIFCFASCKKGKPITPINPNTSELLKEVKEGLGTYKIAYGTEYKIIMMDVDGTNSIELADGSPNCGYVSWSSDAKYVYYASAKGPSETAWEAWRVDVKTKEAIKLSDFGRDVRSLGVSPDDKYLAISLMTGNSSIGNNNDNLTQFNTDLYLIEMSKVEQVISAGNQLKVADLELFISSPPAEQLWYEELNWNPVVPSDGIPVLAYTKTWRYDEDDVSYTHAYTIKADGANNTLILENRDMPIWDFTGTKLTFLGLEVYDVSSQMQKQLKVTGISKEVSGATVSPDGKYILFEVGDESRQGGIARYSTSTSDNKGEILSASNVYEPRWSPKPID